MKKPWLLLMTALVSQKVCFAETKADAERHPLDSLVSCVIDKHEDVLNNLFVEGGGGKGWNNPKAIYALAKQCKAPIPNVKKVTEALNSEKQLCPNERQIAQYVKGKLAQPFENNKVTEAPESFENIDFSMRLFISGYDPKLKYDHNYPNAFALSLPHPGSEFMLEPQENKPVVMSSQQKEIFSEAFEHKQHKSSYFSKDKLHCPYVFRSYPLSPQGNLMRENPLVGFVILDKPVDYHLFME